MEIVEQPITGQWPPGSGTRYWEVRNHATGEPVSGAQMASEPERTPATGALLTKLLAAHLPDGVLCLLQGGGEVGDHLVEQPVDVAAQVGSTVPGAASRPLPYRTEARVALNQLLYGGQIPEGPGAFIRPQCSLTARRRWR